MADSEKKWNRFQRLSVKSGKFSERAKRAENASVKHAHRFIIKRLHSAREVRRNIALWLLGMGVLIAVAATQFFLFQSSYITYAGGSGGTYAEGVRGEIKTLNPLYASTPGEQAVSRLMFSSLLTYDKTGKLRGDLAENVSVLDEGKRYRVTLRPNVLWHDHAKLTADDVVFTVGLIKNPATSIPTSASWQNVEVKKIDTRTVDFMLPSTYAPFPNALTFAVVPQHILQKITPGALRDSRFSAQPVGSGPFSFKLRQDIQGRDAHVVVHMNQNASYYGGTPKIERFQLHSYGASDSLSRAIRSHAVNAVNGVSLADYSQFVDDPAYAASLNPVHAGVYALFNTRSTGALSSVEVRQALQAGTDINAALKSLPVKVSPLETPILSSQTDVSGIAKPAYDKTRAEQLLDEAGWKKSPTGERKKGDEVLTLNVVTIKGADYEGVVENLVSQWRRLGVKAQLRTVDTSDPTQNLASSVLQPRDFDVLVHELYLGADPDVYAFWHSSQAVERGLNFSNYSNGISDDALVSARLRLEDGLRNAKYQAFVRQWLKDAPALGLYQSQMTYVHTKDSTAFDSGTTLITATDRFNDVIYWSTHQAPVYKTP